MRATCTLSHKIKDNHYFSKIAHKSLACSLYRSPRKCIKIRCVCEQGKERAREGVSRSVQEMRQPTGTAGTGIKYMLRYVYVAWHTSTCTPGCSGCPESCSSTLSPLPPFARRPWLMWAKKCSGVKNATLAVALPARMQLISLGQAQNIDHCRQLKREKESELGPTY